jgi:NADH-quinone oxidoreductase subunit G
LAGAKNPVIVLGSFALSSDAASVLAAAAKLGAKILPIPAAANGAGLEYLALTPGANGRTYGQFEGLKAAFISGFASDRLKDLEFLVVHTMQLVGAALKADVVLPQSSNYEKRGTTVNLEGRFLPVHQSPVNGGESVDLIGALVTLGDALDLKLEIRGTRSAGRELSTRFGLEVENIPLEGVFPSKKPIAKAAATFRANGGDVLLAPRMWQERMLTGSVRIRDSIGLDSLMLSNGDASKFGVKDGEKLTVNVNGKDRAVIARVSSTTTVPTLPALEGEMAGSNAMLKIAMAASGDD